VLFIDLLYSPSGPDCLYYLMGIFLISQQKIVWTLCKYIQRQLSERYLEPKFLWQKLIGIFILIPVSMLFSSSLFMPDKLSDYDK